MTWWEFRFISFPDFESGQHHTLCLYELYIYGPLPVITYHPIYRVYIPDAPCMAYLPTLAQQNHLNAGAGYHGTKGENANLGLKKVKRMLSTILSFGFGEDNFPPYLCLSRCQMASIDAPKIRPIWSCALHMCIVQAMIGIPIYHALRMRDNVTCFGLNLEQ